MNANFSLKVAHERVNKRSALFYFGSTKIHASKVSWAAVWLAKRQSLAQHCGMLKTFIASVGPIILSIMGVFVSLKIPSGRAHTYWAVAFLVVGGASAVSVFFEMSGTDQDMADLKIEIGKLRKQTIRGPRLEFSGVKSTNAGDEKFTDLMFSNTSDTDIVDYFISYASYISEIEPDKVILDVRDKAKRQTLNRSNDFTKVSRGMGLSIKVPYVWDAFDEAKRNGKDLYIFATAIYVDKDTDDNHYWVTELCAKILGRDMSAYETKFQPCKKHNGYYWSDINLVQYEK